MKTKWSCWAAVAAFGAVLFAPNLTRAQAGEDTDKSLSPYFQVEDGDPAIDRLPLKATDVDVRIAGVMADVRVVQSYRNEGTRPIEARYVFPGSTRAAVHGLVLRVGNREITAQIREKKQARTEYEEAKRSGKSAALLEQHRPNVFQMNVANILPGDEVQVELRYTELLVPSEARYQFVYPAVVGPRYTGSAGAEGGALPAIIPVPYTRAGVPPASTFNLKVALNAAVPLGELASATHRIDVARDGSKRAVVTLADTGRSEGNRDFILDYALAGARIESGLMLYEGAGENYFLAMIEPPAAVKPDEILPREYVFIVDVSGSMFGFPLEVSKRLLTDLIGRLRPTDTFNVLLFAGGSTLLSEMSLPANQENLRQAINVIGRQSGGGATELLPALQRSLKLPRDTRRSRTFVVVTDGYVNVEKQAFDLIRDHLGEANLFAFGIGSSVNRHLIEGMARVGRGEPFVITDEKTAEAEAERFRAYIEAPVLTRIKLAFEGFDAYDVEPVAVPDMFAARPVIVYGKWRGPREGRIRLQGVAGSGPYSRTLDVAGVLPSEENAALRHLWARNRIATLGDYNHVEPNSELAGEITRLGLAYSLLTDYTSFIAVDRVVRNTKPENLEGVDQPLPMPEGVSDLAVGETPSTPEPQTWMLMVVMLGGLLWAWRSGRLHVVRR